VAMIAIATT